MIRAQGSNCKGCNDGSRAIAVHDVPPPERKPHTFNTGVESYTYKELGMLNRQ